MSLPVLEELAQVQNNVQSCCCRVVRSTRARSDDALV